MASSSGDKESKTLAEQETPDSVKNTSSNGDGSDGVEEEDGELTLAQADELFQKGSKAIEDGDYAEAVDCLSRALEIRVSHYGELANECASAYYKYGCALLYKAQEETDPLGTVPAKPAGTEKSKSALKIDGTGSSNGEGSSSKEQNEENGEETGEEETGEEETGEEDESDLDLSFKLLDIARAIVEKNQEDTLGKVNIFSALGEVFLEREDLEASLNDYLKALSICERLFEPDHRRVVDLNFRICLVLEIGSKISEAIPYCSKAISLCKSQIEKLKENNSQDEIELLSGILSDLEKKLEDLEQAKVNPSSVVSQVMEMMRANKSSAASSSSETKPEFKLPEMVMGSESANSSQMGTIISSNGFDSPTVSTATGDSSGSTVTHLGVVGRGVKRAVVRPVGSEENLSKKQAVESEEKKE